jgi:hypothetical protein
MGGLFLLSYTSALLDREGKPAAKPGRLDGRVNQQRNASTGEWTLDKKEIQIGKKNGACPPEEGSNRAAERT